MKKLGFAIALAGVAAGQVGAQDMGFLDNPDFCHTPGPEQDRDNVVYLNGDGIESHAAGCTWVNAPQTFPAGRSDRIRAHRDNGARTWHTVFTIRGNAKGRVNAHADGLTGLPEYNFSCARWGLKPGE